MTKLIQTSEINGGGSRVVAVPGAGGYAARYVAAHLDREAGSLVASWPATSAGAPLPSFSTPAALVVEDDGEYSVKSPGGTNAGGRLLGVHTTQRPFTIAAVVKADVGFSFLGMTGLEVGRSAAGAWYQRSSTGATVTSAATNGGWVLIFMTAHADSTHSLTVNGTTTGKAVLGAASSSYGGLFFGSATVGQVSQTREIIYWSRDLSASDREKVAEYFQQRYPGLGR